MLGRNESRGLQRDSVQERIIEVLRGMLGGTVRTGCWWISPLGPRTKSHAVEQDEQEGVCTKASPVTEIAA